MCSYVFAYYLKREDGEVALRFPKFPDLISSLPEDAFDRLDARAVAERAYDAAIAALQAAVTLREDIPEGDDVGLVAADGFVYLGVRESMKLELSKVVHANCKTTADFARKAGKSDTWARRMLDLGYPSKASEVEKAIAIFGKRLTHNWRVENDDPAMAA